MQAKLGGDLPGVREYFQFYPYSCLEQRASIAIGLGNPAQWNALMGGITDYMDRDGLLKYWPFLRDGDDYADRVHPVRRRRGRLGDSGIGEEPHRAGAGRLRRRSRRAVLGAMQTADLSIRKIAALEALSRSKNAFNAKWLDSISLEPNLWPTSAVIDWYLILKRQAKLPKRDERMREAEQILRSRLNFQGTTMGFSTEKTDALWWLMISADSNANKLLIALLDAPAWREDVPRLVTGSLFRMQRGHWNTTVANAWGVLAMNKFSAGFEKTPVSGTTSATLAGSRFDHAWKPDDDTKPFRERLPWPAQPEPLQADAGWRRQAVGDTLEHRGDSAQSAAVERLQGHQERGAGAAEDAGTVVAWRCRPRPSRSRSAGRHDVGRRRRPHPRGQHRARQRPRWRFDACARRGERRVGTVWPAYEERTFDAFHAYYRYVPKGRFIVEYSVRLNNPGEFNLPATRVEAMYAPEMFGELPNADWRVVP